MEPLVVFSAGLVIYCGVLTMYDELRTWRSHARKQPVKKELQTRLPARADLFSVPGRGGGGGGRWPTPLGGSV